MFGPDISSIGLLPMRLLAVIITWVLVAFPIGATAETRLYMAETTGCIWCERWDAEIAEIYPRTPEGAAAPLQRFEKSDGAPDGVTLKRKVTFTPTFVLVKDGVELDRIEGYPGEDFFWGLLAMMLDRHDIDFATSG